MPLAERPTAVDFLGVHRFSFLAALVLFAPNARVHAQSPGTQPAYNAADVDFIQGMMHHHAQAIVMSRLASSHTTRKDVQTAARRIIVSQRDEIAMMRRWLERRKQAVPSIDTITLGAAAASMPGMDMGAGAQPMMPGMLSPTRMTELAASHGSKFDRLFLAGMIRHHEGALTMVAKLFGTTGATQDPEIFQLASDIDSDQRAEIARMQQMLPTHQPRSR
jgi:uncharacterized protein (DUF305 family)